MEEARPSCSEMDKHTEKDLLEDEDEATATRSDFEGAGQVHTAEEGHGEPIPVVVQVVGEQPDLAPCTFCGLTHEEPCIVCYE